LTTRFEKDAADVLRRFIHGQARTVELEAAAKALEVSSVAELCRTLAQAFEGWLQLDIEPADVARQIEAHLDGKVSREEFRLWAHCAHSVLTSGGVAGVTSTVNADGSPGKTSSSASALVPTLKVLSFLLDPRHTAPLLKTRCSLLRVKRHLDAGRPVPLRQFLPSLFRDMGTLRFCVVENPLQFSLDVRDHWVDVGLTGPATSDIRLIPLSIFTRSFFLRELPGIVEERGGSDDPVGLELERARGDRFCYHPENDQAIPLRERFPRLGRIPLEFHYFVDVTGLAEIVIDAARITKEHIRFAAKLFCLQNGVRRAMLDGRRVAVCSCGSRWI